MNANYTRGQFFTLRLGKTEPDVLKKLIETAASAGMNMVCIEVEKGMKYDSHPEISEEWALDKKILREIVLFARDLGVEVIPLLPLFSHVNYITEKHPEFKEPGSKVYCCSSPGLYDFTFDLIDEIIDLFEPKYFHIGHDEALNSYDPYKRTTIINCPSCSAKTPGEVFADDVIKYNTFLKKRGIKTMMWADCLLDPENFKDSCFLQSGCYGGAPDNLKDAAELIPKNIVLCDWHYEPAREYPTAKHLQELGFQVLVCPEFEVNSFLFSSYARKHQTKNLKGFMATSWCKINKCNLRRLNKLIKQNAFFFSNPSKVPAGNSTLKKVYKLCAEYDNSMGKGKFRKVFDLNIDGCGAFHSLGWRDLRYMEWETHDPIGGRHYPDAMYIKPGRKGFIEYELSAPEGFRFEELFIMLWMKCPGANSLSILTDSSDEYADIVSNRDFRGNKLDIRRFVENARSFRLRFSVENRKEKIERFIRKFVIEGITKKEKKL